MQHERRVLITGATGDIGIAVAELAVARGYSVAITGRDRIKLRTASARLDIEQNHVFTADLASESEIEELVSSVALALGGIDTVIHCAGIQNTATLQTLTQEQIHQTIDINFTSALLLAKAFRSKRIPKLHPSLVFVSSIAALRGHAGESLYAGSKAALIAATRSLSSELAPVKIRVNAVAPGAVRGQMTEQIRNRVGDLAFGNLVAKHPLGIGDPVDVAEAALFLASPAAKWITGETLVVDGGYSAT